MNPYRSCVGCRIYDSFNFTYILFSGRFRTQKNIFDLDYIIFLIIIEQICQGDMKDLVYFKNQLISRYIQTSMDKEQEVPEKRFQDYQEVFNSQGQAIGFTLPGSEFLFKYDADGGWKDQKGNYYNSKGVLQKIADQLSEDDEDELDEQQIDQFERMLDDQQHGGHKEKNQVNKEKKKEKNQNEAETYESETKNLLEKYRKKQNVREGLPQQLHIYFKMRTKFYQRIKPTVEKAQSVAQSNTQIKRIKAETQQEQQKYKNKNKWLDLAGQFQYSGTQLDEATYDRYWYGFIKANPQNYEEIISEISKSEEFALLELKTFYALKSKFYLKKKMSQTIKQLKENLKGQDNELFKIEIGGLPQNFPCSFILDLLTYSGTPLDEVFSIHLVDEQTADIVLSKKGAQKFINVEGYSHDDKQYIELTVKAEEYKKVLKSQGFFKVGVASGKQNGYKTHTRQLHDTLALEKSREEFIKLYTEIQQKENGKFRFIVSKNVLKKLLMYRGSSIDVLKVEVFQK